MSDNSFVCLYKS